MSEKILKVTVWVWTCSGGDGSAYPRFFATEADAEECAKEDDERFCEDISSYTLEFDESGKLLNPYVPYKY